MADTLDTNPPTPVPETGVADLGLFGKPLFLDPSARALAKVGVVDVGQEPALGEAVLAVFVHLEDLGVRLLISTMKKSCAPWVLAWLKPAIYRPKGAHGLYPR